MKFTDITDGHWWRFLVASLALATVALAIVVADQLHLMASETPDTYSDPPLTLTATATTTHVLTWVVIVGLTMAIGTAIRLESRLTLVMIGGELTLMVALFSQLLTPLLERCLLILAISAFVCIPLYPLLVSPTNWTRDQFTALLHWAHERRAAHRIRGRKGLEEGVTALMNRSEASGLPADPPSDQSSSLPPALVGSSDLDIRRTT